MGFFLRFRDLGMLRQPQACSSVTFFCELISRKCTLRFCKLNANYQKYSINFMNLSSDLNICVTVVNLNVNTVHSRC